MMKNYGRHSSLSGFTLIELSIVLVIIGLIVGGVLVGRDLIRAADIRQTGSLIEKLDTAVNIFRNKYDCLPGDCLNATQFGFAANGNGDGQVYGLDGFGSLNSGVENFQFFQMLIDAKLISDTRVCTIKGLVCSPIYFLDRVGLTIPLPHSTNAGYGGDAAIGIINTSVPNQLPGSLNVPYQHAYIFNQATRNGFAILSANTVTQLDNKFDDGFPLSGKIRALHENAVNGFATVGGCINTGVTPNTYTIGDTYACDLIWRAAF